VIKYIGSKRTLIPILSQIVAALPDVKSVLDAFSGTSRVGHALKQAGYRVTANDHTYYAHTLARCYVEADASRLADEARERITELNRVAGTPGYFTETFCEKSRYLQAHNGVRVDAMREQIATWQLEPILEAVLLVSLMEAADRVDSTCGLQMAYLKKWSARSHNQIELRLPQILPGAGEALRLEAVEAVAHQPCDLIYLDPPYNQHRYLGNYHVWESLVRWDKPSVYGTAMKRIDCRDYKSDFNSRPKIKDAFAALVNRARAKYLLVSFNNEGYLSSEDLLQTLANHGEVASLEVDYKRYVGAQIGIYNPKGEKVGRVSHLRNRELVFLAGPNAQDVLAALTQSPDTATALDAS
jgi:adenine-specific DNA-methyltransferase